MKTQLKQINPKSILNKLFENDNIPIGTIQHPYYEQFKLYLQLFRLFGRLPYETVSSGELQVQYCSCIAVYSIFAITLQLYTVFLVFQWQIPRIRNDGSFDNVISSVLVLLHLNFHCDIFLPSWWETPKVIAYFESWKRYNDKFMRELGTPVPSCLTIWIRSTVFLSGIVLISLIIFETNFLLKTMEWYGCWPLFSSVYNGTLLATFWYYNCLIICHTAEELNNKFVKKGKTANHNNFLFHTNYKLEFYSKFSVVFKWLQLKVTLPEVRSCTVFTNDFLSIVTWSGISFCCFILYISMNLLVMSLNYKVLKGNPYRHDIHKYRVLILQLRILTTEFGNVLSRTILGAIFTLFLSIVLSSYAVVSITFKGDFDKLSSLITPLLFGIVLILIYCEGAYRVSEKINNDTLKRILGCELVSLRQEVLQEIELLLDAIKTIPPNIELLGLLVMHRSTIVKVLGVTMSYLMVLAQFRVTGESSSN